jgi:AraC-like DNA-binding protein
MYLRRLLSINGRSRLEITAILCRMFLGFGLDSDRGGSFMSRFPEYQDALTFNKFGKNDLPFYVLVCRHTKSYRLHYHNFAELSFVIEGSGEEILNGQSHPLKRGTISFLLPNHLHEIVIQPGTVLTKYCCMFDLHLLQSSSIDPIVWDKILKIGSELPSRYDLEGEQIESFERLIEEMFKEYHSNGFGKNTVIRSKLSEACVYLLRTVQESIHQSGTLNMEKQGAVMEMLKVIHMHYNEELSLTFLSETLGRTPTYLSSIFKRHVGHTFLEYLHALRVGRATGLLAATNLSISEIALEVGFGDFRTFRRVFKEMKGMSPLEFRHRSHSNDDNALSL